MKEDDENIIETDYNTSIVLSIPSNTVKLEMIVTMTNEKDETFKAARTMYLPEIVEARITGREWSEENARYVITDVGNKLLNQKEKN